jgi:hypothetical protein
MQFRNYFEYEGKKYYTGTVLIVKNNGEQKKAIFICYDLQRDKYVYQIGDCKYHLNKNDFQKRLVCITQQLDNSVKIPVTKTKTDMQISCLFIGWTWYIFLMSISAIFNDAIGLWILISVVFFNWRKKKIKEEGTYIEW